MNLYFDYVEDALSQQKRFRDFDPNFINFIEKFYESAINESSLLDSAIVYF